MLGGTDQFVLHLFLMQGSLNQVLRDVCLVMPDFLHVILPVIEYKKENVDLNMPNTDQKQITKDRIKPLDVLACLVIVLCLWLIGVNL